VSEHRSARTPSRSDQATMPRILVTQVKSTIGTKPVHRKTMKALGLAGIGRSTNLPDSADVRGMLHKVSHLVTVEAGQELR
jgi:large subunit ribosomal protein L30